MSLENKTYLQFVDFTNVESWSTYSLLGDKLDYTKNYPFVKIGEFLKRNKTQIKVRDEVEYKRPTIKINGQGVFIRDKKKGKDIGTKNQFLISSGQFLMSKIDARNGAFGVVPEALDGGIITGNFWTFDVDYEKIDPHFLTLITKTKKFQTLSQTASVGTTNRNYLQEVSFLNFKIPLPSVYEQQQILKTYNDKIYQAKALEEKANSLEVEVERYLFDELSIKSQKNISNMKGLNFLDFSNIERWGVDYNLGNFNNSVLNSNIFSNKKLKEIISINPTTIMPKEQDSGISFIPMECISDDYGEVIELREKKIQESKGYTKFQEGDLIWARITPCMQNGKSAIVKNLKNGYGVGSTEFHVLRNNNPNIDLEYIYHILRLRLILKNAMSHFTGSAGQQRVPKSYLEELSIPIPTFDKQREISSRLKEIKSSKKDYNAKAFILKIKAEEELEQIIFN